MISVHLSDKFSNIKKLIEKNIDKSQQANRRFPLKGKLDCSYDLR